MKMSGTFYLANAFGIIVASIAHAADPADLGGFMLGSSLEAAQNHARAQEWKLVPLSDNLPGTWTVEGANLSLFVCNGVVSSVSETLEGDFEQFAALVFSMQLEFGQPDVQILSYRSSIGVISTIDARFDIAGGGASVQLQSLGGDRTFSANHWIETECQ
ncbi:hypothetical protein [Phaeobacter gallaeciensis]|uniref:hypothetical protein n=2 Tax=Roseobacteraceae TaxID=2854170 RepID=UPI0010580329|nr:hypothetical protein [Phaeobacter gallaeciensis]MDE4060893.1 hypothetical protein [Phaeobacter gallaeciensis]MDE4123912.1 hypothetical protein [Phaeobacter gallaeciensis]MDE4192010.1 hypothetical protein [Phaeobacter gallaeciensis]MDE4200473.1 hypothetical protein [Phaeobacter gallaeciensis]MDE4208765.1 hypothetical protein [Phaeobacter gallaeciensis]